MSKDSRKWCWIEREFSVHSFLHFDMHLTGICPTSVNLLRNVGSLFSITSPHWRLLQPRNASFWISVTEEGILINCRLLQPWNALEDITWIELDGINITSNLLQSSNAFDRIVFNDSGKLKYLTDEFRGKIINWVRFSAYNASLNTVNLLGSDILIYVKLEHFSKIPLSKTSKLEFEGILKVVSKVQL